MAAGSITVSGPSADKFDGAVRTGVQTKIEQKLEALAVEAYKAKVAFAKAEDAYKEKLQELYTELAKNELTDISITDLKVLEEVGLKRELKASESIRTNSTADPKAYLELVSEEEFFASIKVQMTEAKKFVLPKHYHKFITDQAPSKFLQISGK